jgi:hypothetical protein
LRASTSSCFFLTATIMRDTWIRYNTCKAGGQHAWVSSHHSLVCVSHMTAFLLLEHSRNKHAVARTPHISGPPVRPVGGNSNHVTAHTAQHAHKSIQ